MRRHCDVGHELLRSGLAMDPPTPEQMESGEGLRVQGMLYCNSCEAHDGAWRCVPGESPAATTTTTHPAPAAPRFLAERVLHELQRDKRVPGM